MDKAVASALKEARKYERQGDKKGGQQAADLYEKAVEKFKAAYERGAQGEQCLDALMGKGDCYHKWAQALVTKVESYPNEELTIEAERRAHKRAEALFEHAAQSYKQTDTGGCHMDFNACVNCGNTLASWSELCEPRVAEKLLLDAIDQYQSALQLDSEDNEVWQNLGDASIQLGKSQCELGKHADGQASFLEAFNAYSQSCGLSDSRKGDDLPGLLENWGLGLVTASKCVKDVALREEYAKSGIKRLQDAAHFQQGEASPYCGIGDGLIAKAEVETPDNALETLADALSEGFEEALKRDRGCVEAVLGTAEVHTTMAKLLLDLGNKGSALYSFTKAADVYGHALASPQALGGFHDRSVVQYNYACTSILCGRPRIAQIVLRRLVNNHGCHVNDLTSDADFESIRGEPWFQQLIVEATKLAD